MLGTRTFRLVSSARSGLWFVPVMCVLAGVAVSFGTIAIDRHFDFELVPRALTGEPDAAGSSSCRPSPRRWCRSPHSSSR